MEIILFLIISVLLLLFIVSTPQKTKQDEQVNQFISLATKVRPLYNMKMELKIADNGGTRLGIDRRKFHYTAYIPEKRSGMDRRRGFDRRRIEAQRIGADRRSILNTPKKEETFLEYNFKTNTNYFGRTILVLPFLFFRICKFLKALVGNSVGGFLLPNEDICNIGEFDVFSYQ